MVLKITATTTKEVDIPTPLFFKHDFRYYGHISPDFGIRFWEDSELYTGVTVMRGLELETECTNYNPLDFQVTEAEFWAEYNKVIDRISKIKIPQL